MGFSPENVRTADIEKRVRMYKEANRLRRERAELQRYEKQVSMNIQFTTDKSFHKRSKTTRGQDSHTHSHRYSKSPYISRTSLSPSPIKPNGSVARTANRKRMANKSYSAVLNADSQSRSRSPILNRLSHQGLDRNSSVSSSLETFSLPQHNNYMLPEDHSRSHSHSQKQFRIASPHRKSPDRAKLKSLSPNLDLKYIKN
jgi:hypothetical protein